mmetsp:Transcript_47128/g.86476  ORF Transcript_47128/g.86476 Transcript_47128/m.86476 type:complete len:557 (+) Transcript_47128:102-1772(+)
MTLPDSSAAVATRRCFSPLPGPSPRPAHVVPQWAALPVAIPSRASSPKAVGQGEQPLLLPMTAAALRQTAEMPRIAGSPTSHPARHTIGVTGTQVSMRRVPTWRSTLQNAAPNSGFAAPLTGATPSTSISPQRKQPVPVFGCGSISASAMSAEPAVLGDAHSVLHGASFRPRSPMTLERRPAFPEPRVAAPPAPAAVPFPGGAPRNYAAVRRLQQDTLGEGTTVVQVMGMTSSDVEAQATPMTASCDPHESAKAKVLAALESAKQAREDFLRAADANIALLERAAAEADDEEVQGAACKEKGSKSSVEKVLTALAGPFGQAAGPDGAGKAAAQCAAPAHVDNCMSPTRLLARAQEAESQAEEDRKRWEAEKERLQDELLQARHVAAHASAALERLKLPTEGGGSGETGSPAPVNGSIVPRIEFRNSSNDTTVVVEPIEIKRVPEAQVDKIDSKQQLREPILKESDRCLGFPTRQPPVVVHTAPLHTAQSCSVPVVRRSFSPVSIREISPASSPGRSDKLGEQEEEEEARMFKDEETRRLLKAELEKLRAWYKARHL